MKPLARQHAWKFAALIAMDGAMFGLTNTGNVPSIGLMAGFLLLALTFYCFVRGLLSFARLYGLSIRRKRRLALVVTGLASGVVALQSIGELNSRDILVVVPLMLIGYIYSSYGKSTGTLPNASGLMEPS
ncbi:MAG TPA: hypothetical protein VII55_00600 [Candidatus Saccharimonadales bacterium]